MRVLYNRLKAQYNCHLDQRERSYTAVAQNPPDARDDNTCVLHVLSQDLTPVFDPVFLNVLSQDLTPCF